MCHSLCSGERSKFTCNYKGKKMSTSQHSHTMNELLVLMRRKRHSQVRTWVLQKKPWSLPGPEHLHQYLHASDHRWVFTGSPQQESLWLNIPNLLHLHWHLMATVMSTFILSLLHRKKDKRSHVPADLWLVTPSLKAHLHQMRIVHTRGFSK